MDLRENLLNVERTVKDLFESLGSNFKTSISKMKAQLRLVNDFINGQNEKFSLNLIIIKLI